MEVMLLSLACNNYLLLTADGNSTRAMDDQREPQWKSRFSRWHAVVSRSPQSKVTAQQLRTTAGSYLASLATLVDSQ
jgi:hypothetical protein